MSRVFVNPRRERGASLRPWLLAALAASAIAALAPAGTADAAELAARGEDASKAARPVGAVYLMTNKEGSNEISHVEIPSFNLSAQTLSGTLRIYSANPPGVLEATITLRAVN